MTSLTNSILPAIVLHTAGNLYSNFDLWLHGQAEWQASAGADAAMNMPALAIALGLVAAAMLWAYARLARTAAATQ